METDLNLGAIYFFYLLIYFVLFISISLLFLSVCYHPLVNCWCCDVYCKHWHQLKQL